MDGSPPRLRHTIWMTPVVPMALESGAALMRIALHAPGARVHRRRREDGLLFGWHMCRKSSGQPHRKSSTVPALNVRERSSLLGRAGQGEAYPPAVLEGHRRPSADESLRVARCDPYDPMSKKGATDHPAMLMHGWIVPTAAPVSNRLDFRHPSTNRARARPQDRLERPGVFAIVINARSIWPFV